MSRFAAHRDRTTVNRILPPVPLTALRIRRPKRRLVLVALDWTRAKDPRVPLGHASLLASLRRSGADVTSLTIPLNAADARFETILARVTAALAVAPADLGIGAYIWNEPHVQRLLPALRAAGYRGRIILGGPQISYQNHGLEHLYPDADAFVRGYGEQALIELLACDAPGPIPGVHWAGEPDRGEQASVRLDELPSPFLTGVVDVPRDRRFIRWETQRGCPYRCSFCQHREADARPVLRRFDINRIDDEIRLFTRHAVRSIAVLDPVFNLGEHAYDVLGRLRHHKYTGRLSLQCHSDAMREPERFLRACEGLDVHLEFGLQTIHEAEMRAVQRRQSLDRFATIVDMLRHEHSSFEVSLIYGLPEQTLASFRDSVRWCLRRRIPVIRAYPLVLLRGTSIAAERDRWGLREDDSTIPAVVESTTFDRADWQRMAALANALSRSESHHPLHLASLEHPRPSTVFHSPPPA